MGPGLQVGEWRAGSGRVGGSPGAGVAGRVGPGGFGAWDGMPGGGEPIRVGGRVGRRGRTGRRRTFIQPESVCALAE